MEWAAVSAIIAIVGLIGTVAVPLTKNTKAMTQLTERLGFLGERISKEEAALEEFKDKAARKHGAIYDTLNEHENKLIGHEARITILEEEKRK